MTPTPMIDLPGLLERTSRTFALSIRLRADELALMRRLGASRGRVAVFLATEAAILLGGALAITAACTVVAPLLAPLVMRVAAG